MKFKLGDRVRVIGTPLLETVLNSNENLTEVYDGIRIAKTRDLELHARALYMTPERVAALQAAIYGFDGHLCDRDMSYPETPNTQMGILEAMLAESKMS